MEYDHLKKLRLAKQKKKKKQDDEQEGLTAEEGSV